MDKNFESLPKTNISLIKKMMGNSINEKSTQSFNSMTKQKINTQLFDILSQSFTSFI